VPMRCPGAAPNRHARARESTVVRHDTPPTQRPDVCLCHAKWQERGGARPSTEPLFTPAGCHATSARHATQRCCRLLLQSERRDMLKDATRCSPALIVAARRMSAAMRAARRMLLLLPTTSSRADERRCCCSQARRVYTRRKARMKRVRVLRKKVPPAARLNVQPRQQQRDMCEQNGTRAVSRRLNGAACHVA